MNLLRFAGLLFFLVLAVKGWGNPRARRSSNFECEDHQDCKIIDSCEYEKTLPLQDLKFCGIFYDSREVCCLKVKENPTTPSPTSTSTSTTTSTSKTTSTSTTTSTPTTTSTSTTTTTSVLPISLHKNFKLINDVDCGKCQPLDRVSFGENASLFEFPWVVLLGYGDEDKPKLSFDCGGSLISTRFVVTAAHCIVHKDLKPRNLKSVRVGEHTISKENDCPGDIKDSKCYAEDFLIDKTIVHENYGEKIHDIGLIRLSSAVEITTSRKNVKTVCLPVMEHQVKIDINCKISRVLSVAGWGFDFNQNNKSDILQKTTAEYWENDRCARFYDEAKIFEPEIVVNIQETTMCAMGKSRSDVCNGDSGGPLTGMSTIKIRGRPVQRSFLRGIVAHGVRCGDRAAYPGIYTRITSYVRWILDNMDLDDNEYDSNEAGNFFDFQRS